MLQHFKKSMAFQYETKHVPRCWEIKDENDGDEKSKRWGHLNGLSALVIILACSGWCWVALWNNVNLNS